MRVDRQSRELLRAVVGRPTNTSAQRIDALAASIRDWDSIVQLAREHRVLPTLFLRLAGTVAVPIDVQDRLRAEYSGNMLQNLASAVELIAVLREFEREGIPAMPFKGVVLGAAIYGDLTTRQAGDLDLLIHRHQLTRAAAILTKRRYDLKTPVCSNGEPIGPDCYEYHFERQADGLKMELRWRLELPKFTRNLGMDWVWQQRRFVKLAGTDLPDLDPELKLLILCMHGSKHAWSRLAWICDVGQLLASCPDLDWHSVVGEAKRVGLWRVLALGVLLAHDVNCAIVPATVLRSFESDPSARTTAQYIGENVFNAPGSPPPGRVPYNIHLLGRDDRLRFLLSPNALRPNERDRAVVRLPASLDFLYYLVRPARLLWDRTARL